MKNISLTLSHWYQVSDETVEKHLWLKLLVLAGMVVGLAFFMLWIIGYNQPITLEVKQFTVLGAIAYYLIGASFFTLLHWYKLRCEYLEEDEN